MNYHLKAARKRAGLTQDEIARIIGVSTRMYQSYECDDCEPRVRTAIRIANALDIHDLSALWNTDPNQTAATFSE